MQLLHNPARSGQHQQSQHEAEQPTTASGQQQQQLLIALLACWTCCSSAAVSPLHQELMPGQQQQHQHTSSMHTGLAWQPLVQPDAPALPPWHMTCSSRYNSSSSSNYSSRSSHMLNRAGKAAHEPDQGAQQD
jgi:hypothetical protein